MKKILTSTFLVCLIGCHQSTSGPDQAQARAELLEVYESIKQAHLETSVNKVIQSAGSEVINVTNGAISRQSRDQLQEFFLSYFEGASYEEYRDLEEPIVQVSSDGGMGWVISRLGVRRSQQTSGGEVERREFTYAGILVFEKTNGVWAMVANASTFEQPNN